MIPPPSGRGGRAILIGRGLDKSPVIEQSNRSLSGQKPAELQDNADQSVPAGWLVVHLHHRGETGGDMSDR